MTTSKFLLILLWPVITISGCSAQSSDKLNLSKLIFHSSRCNGLCPKFDIEIDSTKNIFVNREYFKTKSEIDKKVSGQFKGVLTDEDFNKLLGLLKDINLETLTFPKSGLMDGVEITIIVYYNGQRKYLKSSEPPGIAKNLIAFLTSLGDNKRLPATNQPKDIEN